MPEVSVIIPLYNRAGLVREAIDSVLAQTFKDFELIIVDDGSTDGSVDTVLSYDDPRITLLRHERNKGQAAAHNTGIAHASGRYVGFLDSDDLWRPAKLERQITAMRTRQWPASCAGFSLKFYDGPEQPKRIKPRTDWFWACLFRFPFGGGSNVIVERSLIEQVGPYDESLPCAIDLDWFMRVPRDVTIGVVKDNLMVKRRCDAINVGDTQYDHNLIRFYKTWMTSAGGKPRLTARELRRFKGGMHWAFIFLARNRGDRAEMARHMLYTMLLTPVAVASVFFNRIVGLVRARPAPL